ncbi:pyruvate kinase, partial [Salinarimonas soli]
TTEKMISAVDASLLNMDEYNRDDMMVVVAGSPPGISGNTNMIQVHLLGQERTR